VTAIVDDYKNQITNTVPAVSVLSAFKNLYTPGTAWNNGTILNSTVMSYNNQYVVNVTSERSLEQEIGAYYDDRRNQSYSVIDGLGPLTSTYLTGATSVATIPAFDTTTSTTEYDDYGTGNAGGSLTSPLGDVVALVNNIRSFSTTPAKNAYNYPRPWRLNTTGAVDDSGNTDTETVTVVSSATTTAKRTWDIFNSSVQLAPSLKVVRSTTPSSDGAFPSGHTNAAYSAALALAYSIPERYQELLTRASELGDNRILAGMHSPLDVMGGRMTGTAWASAILYNNDMSNTTSPAISKTDAYTAAHTYVYAQTATSANSLYSYAHSESNTLDRFADWATNKKNFTDRLTYGFPQINSTTSSMLVPKGAEVLLETRQPYLSSNQRRWALYTTGIASGYPVLDDTEGWGRLNLFAAADGYGALNGNVIVTMDATQGGFNASDTWRNNISGSGKLFKRGTGVLTFAGNNTYSGGTQVDAGTLVADSATALGTGNVVLNGGTLVNATPEGLVISGSYNQLSTSTLELDLDNNNKGLLTIAGIAGFKGTLNVVIGSDFVPVSGQSYKIISFGASSGSFGAIKFSGTTANPTATVKTDGLYITFP
jgi:autotransporter-associated beta strand protein